MKSILKQIVAKILTIEAKMVLKKYRPKIVGVTGTVGKTTTKDAIYNVFSSFIFARKSQKSFNSEIGIPLTILGCQNGWLNPFVWIKNIFYGLFLIFVPARYPEWLILEVGADRPKDIEKASRWLRPDVAIVTKLSDTPAHVEFFGSPEKLVEEKSNIVKWAKDNALIVLNNDDTAVMTFKNLAEGRHVVTYGFKEGSDYLGSNYEIDYENTTGLPIPVGIKFRIDHNGSSLPVKIKGILGKQFCYAVLASIAVAGEKEFNLIKATESFDSFEPASGRMRILKGIKGSVIIDDSYNSSPTAVEEALNTLKEVRTSGRKIAVLGDMLELGKMSSGAHQKVGSLVAKSSDILFAVGVRGRGIADGALSAGMPDANIFQFDDSYSAGQGLQNFVNSGDVILIKGSQGMRMEKTVEEIMLEPELKDLFLVRQEKEWNMR